LINAQYTETKATLRSLCEIVIYCAAGAIAVLASLNNLDDGLVEKWWPQAVRPVLTWLVDNASWLVIVFIVIGFVAKIGKEHLERTWIWASVRDIVERVQRDAFAQQQGMAHHHRATLFRHSKYKWWPFPWRYLFPAIGRRRWFSAGWLTPVVRSGHTTQHSTTYFLAPDDADNVEGVVGVIWAKNSELAVTAGGALPPDAGAAAITAYAQATFISETHVRGELSKGKTLYASFRGIPIEGRAGQKWGVLILDSRDANAAVAANLNIAPYAYCLGKLLERV
jgi:hypothetical protein